MVINDDDLLQSVSFGKSTEVREEDAHQDPNNYGTNWSKPGSLWNDAEE